MKENSNIDELLNSFIDGELTERQRTEVQRLIAHDEQIAEQLKRLEKCKTLVGSLPCAEAPAEMLEDIKASLERRTLLGQPGYDGERFSEREGTKHLLIRRVTAAAAMIGLIAVLAVVIYTIVAPEGTAEKPVAVEDWRQPTGKVDTEKPRPAIAAIAEKSIAKAGINETNFNGRLELKTGAITAVNAFINRAIANNGLSESVSSETDGDKSIYAIGCSRESLNLLLADLGSIWPKFDSATLFVETEQLGRQIAVESVDAEQIAEIVNQDSSKSCIQTAKDFAVLNNMARLLPGREILTAIDNKRPNLLTIPKPVLTSAERAIKKPEAPTQGGAKLHLTIVVAGSE